MKKMSPVRKKNNLKKNLLSKKKNLASFPSGAIKTLFSFGLFDYL